MAEYGRLTGRLEMVAPRSLLILFKSGNPTSLCLAPGSLHCAARRSKPERGKKPARSGRDDSLGVSRVDLCPSCPWPPDFLVVW